jgi:hypothetical protein
MQAALQQQLRVQQFLPEQQQQQQQQQFQQQSREGMPPAAAVPRPPPTPDPIQLNSLPIRAYLDQTVVPILLDGKHIFLLLRSTSTWYSNARFMAHSFLCMY